MFFLEKFFMLPYFLISSVTCCVWLFFIGVATHCELDYVCFMREKKTESEKKERCQKIAKPQPEQPGS